MSRAPEMEAILSSVESEEDEELSVAAILSRGLAIAPSTVHMLASELWSFLSADARIWLNQYQFVRGLRCLEESHEVLLISAPNPTS